MAGSSFFKRTMKLGSLLAISVAILALAGCGQGNGPQSFSNEPATPLPPGGDGPPFDSGLLTNGDFETGEEPWFGNAANVQLDGDNFVNFADVAVAGQPFDVNLSQVVAITEGETYTLTFKARSNRNRTIAVGIGLNEAPWTNITETANLTPNWQTFQYNITAVGFGIPNSRVLFDMGADTGQVIIDDVSLVVAGGGGPGFGTPIDPDTALFRTEGGADLVPPDDYDERTGFGSGSIIEDDYAGDEVYSPVLSVFSGADYGANVAQVGFIGFRPGFLGAYETVHFKVRGMPNFVIFVKLFDGVDALRINLTSSSLSKDLGNGWYQVSIPVSRFSGVDQATGIVFESDDSSMEQFRMLLTDIGFSGVGMGGPPPLGDHGPGTAGVFTETTTESAIPVTSITNSIDFGGNNTIADPNSMAIPAFEGDVVLSIEYQNSGSTYGGAVLNFGGVDLTAYDTLNFTVDTTGMANFADLTIQIEPPGAGAAGTNVLLSSYTPVSTSGNWATYAIPLADYTATDFAAAANLGFWNPKDGADALTFGTLYVDDVYFSTEGGGADHGPGTGGVFTETTTESTITVTSITNSIDFGGNNTIADPNSMAIPAFEGDVVLAIEYQDTGSTYGGAVLNFAGVDLTAYDTLNFTVDTTGIAGFADLTIQIEPPGAGAAGTNVPLSGYAPVSTSGNWATYAIPLADFTATDFSAAANLGFWNPSNGGALVFGTLYVDDVYFSTEGGGGGADHGPGTASVFTETTTESAITVTSITNSIDFGGNNTIADPNSMAIPAFEGDVVLAIEYQDTGSTYGGAVLNFGGVDLTAYDTLNFTVDTTGMANFGDLTIQIEPPGAGAAGTNVLLSSYTPVSTSGNWATYAIPLADYTATDFAAAANLGFWNPKDGADALTFGTLYVDDVYFSTEGGGGGGGEIAVNGGFESGDFTGWSQFEASSGDQTVNMGMAGDTSSEGSFHLEINNTATGTNSLIKQERVGLGTVTPGIAWTVTFDARGSFDPGGVAFAQVFSETAGGNEDCTGCGILGGAPLAVNADPTVWTSFSFSGTAGPNTESLTLQLEAVTGGGNLANMFYDNISIVVGDGGD